MKKAEREMQLMTELLNRKEEELKNIGAEQEEELEKLRVELIAVKESKDSDSPSAFGAEFYRKKILAMQEHYENQIHELISSSLPAISPSESVKCPPSKTSAHVPEAQNTPMDVPSMDEFDKMAADARSSMIDKVKFKTPATSSETQNQAMNNTAAAEPALKKKKNVTFQLTSSQTAKEEEKEFEQEFMVNVGLSTPTKNRSKKRGFFDTSSIFPSSSTAQGGSGASVQSSGGPLNEDFWTSIAAQEDSSFSDVFFSPQKTQTQSCFSSSVTPPTPFHPPPIQSSSSSRVGGNSSGSATTKSVTPTKFKFTSVPKSQVSSAATQGDIIVFLRRLNFNLVLKSNARFMTDSL